MEMAHNVSIPELTEAISARLVAQWEAWKNQDAASNNAIIADDFNSFWPDGSRFSDGRGRCLGEAQRPVDNPRLLGHTNKVDSFSRPIFELRAAQ
jgi:hypothetical protein